MKKSIAALFCAAVLACAIPRAAAHCEIPCGIYNDEVQMQLIYDDILTIGKSVHEILHLQGAGKAQDVNQLVRWIANKDLHAQKIQATVAQYFMTQRVKPVEPSDPGYAGYVGKLVLLHKLQIEAMKARQTVDPAAADRMKALAAEFEQRYFGKSVAKFRDELAPHRH